MASKLVSFRITEDSNLQSTLLDALKASTYTKYLVYQETYYLVLVLRIHYQSFRLPRFYELELGGQKLRLKVYPAKSLAKIYTAIESSRKKVLIDTLRPITGVKPCSKLELQSFQINCLTNRLTYLESLVSLINKPR